MMIPNDLDETGMQRSGVHFNDDLSTTVIQYEVRKHQLVR